MADELVAALTAIGLGIVGVAAIAIFVSKQANTGNVVTQAGSTFAQALTCAANPGGGSCGSNITTKFNV